MTQLAEPKRWLTLPEAAIVAHRSERTLRNWMKDGVLRPAARGMFDRNVVLAAERKMRNRRGRPAPAAPRIVQAAGAWIEVTACGTHLEALNAGLIALTCSRCRLRPSAAPEGER